MTIDQFYALFQISIVAVTIIILAIVFLRLFGLSAESGDE